MKKQIRIIRGLIQVVVEGANNLLRFSGLGVKGETITDREMFKHYGFTSRNVDADETNKIGSEGIFVVSGSVIYCIAEDDRRYRIAIEKGEVALYTDEGDKIHFLRNNQILIKTSNKLTIDATEDVEIINAKRLTATLTESAKLISPTVNLGVTGFLALVTLPFIAWFNSHTHKESGGGETLTPTQQAVPAANTTTNVFGS